MVGVVLALGVVWLCVNPASFEKIFTRVEDDGPEEETATRIESNGSGEAINDGRIGGNSENENVGTEGVAPLAMEVLARLEVKGRAPKTGYTREQFYNGWPTVEGCSLRQRIIKRDFGESAVILDGCNVVAGEYDEPYTGEHLAYGAREEISKGVQIDHVVALSDAWQKGAQNVTSEERYAMATDPLNLLAVEAAANKKKSDGDAATWLPPNKKFRCQYVARQVSVKYKYKLWVTEAEKGAIERVLAGCPGEKAVGV